MENSKLEMEIRMKKSILNDLIKERENIIRKMSETVEDLKDGKFYNKCFITAYAKDFDDIQRKIENFTLTIIMLENLR